MASQTVQKKRKTSAPLPILHVLLIEDDVVDAEWVKNLLSDYKSINFKIEWVDLLSKAKKVLSQKEFDVIVLDLHLPDGFGLNLFKEIKELSGKASIILNTGTPEGKMIAMEALELGAQDYLVKGETTPINFIRSILFSEERGRLFHSLEQKNRELDSFSHMVSHDLKQPLTVIKAAIENLNHPSSISDVEKILNHQVDIMSQKINTLLQYASAGGGITHREEVDLSLCVQDALDNLKIDTEKENADIHLDPLPKAFVCKPLIELLFQNLISNAIKFRKPKSSPKIFISAQSEKDFCVISIKDNGMGIDQDQIKNTIFELFHRSRYSQGIPGHGIGLAMCKKIIESHGGRIWYESKRDQGTIFHFSLPSTAVLALKE